MAGALGRRGSLLSVLLSDPASELAAAVREAKILPYRAANRERLGRLIGPVPDLEARADAGPALILAHVMLHGGPPGEALIRDSILPLMTGGQVIVSVKR
jgi:hypothetical protein